MVPLDGWLSCCSCCPVPSACYVSRIFLLVLHPQDCSLWFMAHQDVTSSLKPSPAPLFPLCVSGKGRTHAMYLKELQSFVPFTSCMTLDKTLLSEPASYL